jgi:hypothetical protein
MRHSLTLLYEMPAPGVRTWPPKSIEHHPQLASPSLRRLVVISLHGSGMGGTPSAETRGVGAELARPGRSKICLSPEIDPGHACMVPP